MIATAEMLLSKLGVSGIIPGHNLSFMESKLRDCIQFPEQLIMQNDTGDFTENRLLADTTCS